MCAVLLACDKACSVQIPATARVIDQGSDKFVSHAMGLGQKDVQETA